MYSLGFKILIYLEKEVAGFKEKAVMSTTIENKFS
jgi:hypothetical protein